MLEANCPGCGAKVVFRADTSVFAVCQYCQATIVRSDVSLEMIGKVAIVDDGWSPLQLYTTGRYKNQNFVVVGRVMLGWEQGTWNEWFLAYDNGQTGWLSEAQGFYAISSAVEDQTQIPSSSEMKTGTQITLRKIPFVVQDIKKTTCLLCQGELPYRAAQGSNGTTVDLSGPNGAFASIEFSGEDTRVFVGSYEEFDHLHFSNLRVIDGWS